MPSKPVPAIYDSRGRPLPLGAEVGKGGEGGVWEVRELPDRLAKIYHAPTAEQGAKLRAMLGLSSDRLLKVTAWPVATLHDRRGEVRGFLMSRAVGQQIHMLYGPKSRIASFPKATWPFLLQAAANLARAFAVVHEQGLVVGDVNHGNSLVSDQATVALIDCDSFQVPNGGRPFYCGVGVETHVPPELQGSNLSRVVRTPNHDAFGLAVLIFQILFMGRHPFSGRFLGPGDMPMPRAIQELRFAYGSGAAARQMQPPPNTLPLDALAPEVAALFERAFSQQGRAGGRPAALEWVAGLESLGRQLRTCDRNPAHQFFRNLPACPWCEIETRSGILLFALWTVVPVAPTGLPGTFQLSLVWCRIVAVRPPGPAPGLPDPALLKPSPSAAAVAEGRKRLVWIAAAILFGFVGSGASFFVKELAIVLIPLCLWIAGMIAQRGGRAALRQTQGELRAVESELDKLRRSWEAEATPTAFESKLRELEQKRSAYLDLPAARQRGMAQLQANLRQRQFEQYLDGQRIERAKIKQIGPTRRAVLQSYGIETARDVKLSDILRIPGFGPAMAQSLVAWRLTVERAFVFDPRRGVDPADARTLESRLAGQKVELERELAAGAVELDRIQRAIVLRRETLLPQLTSLAGRVAQARVDLRALRRGGF